MLAIATKTVMFKAILIATEDFLKNYPRRNIWLLGLSVFGTCVYFFSSFYVALPEELSKLERTVAKYETDQREQPEYLSLGNKVDDCFNTLRKTTEYIHSQQQMVSTTQTMTREELLTGSIAIIAAKNKVAETLGSVKGSDFQNHAISGIFKGAEEILGYYEQYLSAIETWYINNLKGNKGAETQKLTEIDDYAASSKLGAELIAKVESYKRNLPKLERDYEIEVDRDIREVKTMTVKTIGAGCALLYGLVFLVWTFQAIKRFLPEARKRIHIEQTKLPEMDSSAVATTLVRDKAESMKPIVKKEKQK